MIPATMPGGGLSLLHKIRIIMKKFLFVIAFFILLSNGVISQGDVWSRVKITGDTETIGSLASLGIDLTEGTHKKGSFFITELSQRDIDKVVNAGHQVEVLIHDMTKYYVERNEGLSDNVDDYRSSGEWEIPEDFEFGSMTGHCTFDEVVDHLDNMATKYPDLITVRESIGQSIEGRELWMVKISDNPNTNETEPEALYTSLHHAREPAGVMAILFYMYYLLENYDDDAMIQHLVDNTEMYFVPVVNPDGYVFNESTNPNGGGMWRKNRRNNQNGCWGVDLNRNYGYKWGYDNNGSSPDPCDETYRGTAAFSEPEIAAIRDFCELHEFIFAINYHTYSDLLLYPWGYTSDPCPDDALFYAFSEFMTQDSHYTFGAGSTTIYPTNGGSDDWMYGEQGTKPMIFSFTPELGGQGDGFWCPLDRIIPIAQENMIMNIAAAAFTGNYATISDVSPTLTGETMNYFKFEIQRLGLEEGGSFTVSLEPVTPEITAVGNPVVFENMTMLETIADSISYTLDASVTSGQTIQFLVNLDNGYFVKSDTITKVYGQPVVIFQDDCNTLANWAPGFWDLTTATYHSPTGSITDSKNGNYSNNQTNIIQLTEEIDLTNAVYAQLSFWAKWEIEQGWDYVQVLATNTGTSWTALEGNYTVTGNENQAGGEPLYDGFQTTWVMEEMSLQEFLGGNLSLRFKLKSDTYVTEDGFYFDDLTVTIVDMATGVREISLAEPACRISDPFPNPAGNTVRLEISLPANGQNFSFGVYTLTGQKVYERSLEKGMKQLSLSVDNWEPGIYFYRIEGEGTTSGTRKMVVK